MSGQLRLDTSNLGADQRYSFLETPQNMHASRGQLGHQALPPSTASDIQVAEPQVGPPPTQMPMNEKSPQYQQDMSAYGYPSGPSIAQHPANYAPYADEPPPPPQPQQVQSQTTIPHDPHTYIPHSPGPLPTKADPMVSHSPHPSSPPPMALAAPTPLYSPSFPQYPLRAASGAPMTPAGMDITAHHRPGQIRHPDQEIRGGTWSTSLCGCSDIGACCLGFFCPCVLYGKTQHRLSRKSRSEDPTNMLGYSCCNGSCTAMALLCGCHWLFATIQHTRTRKAYSIEGNIASDCIRATCCTCCTLIQDEREIKKREESRRLVVQTTGAALVSPYMTPVQMSYAP